MTNPSLKLFKRNQVKLMNLFSLFITFPVWEKLSNTIHFVFTHGKISTEQKQMLQFIVAITDITQLLSFYFGNENHTDTIKSLIKKCLEGYNFPQNPFSFILILVPVGLPRLPVLSNLGYQYESVHRRSFVPSFTMW